MNGAYSLWAALVVGGFFLGSVMFCYLLPKLLLNKDICAEHPDHNPGAANVFLSCGVEMGILCLFLDMAKGFLPVWIALRRLGTDSLWFSAVMAAPVLGHAIAPLNHMRGGKCIATSFGVLLALMPVSNVVFVLAALYILFSTLVKLNPHSKRSIVTFGLFTLISVPLLLLGHKDFIAVGCVAISLTVIYRHRVAPDAVEDSQSADAAPDSQPAERKK